MKQKRIKPLTEPHGEPKRKRKAKRKLKLSAKVRAARAANMKRVRRSQEANLTVVLRMQHFVNGVVFGPGKITVPHSLGQQFMKEEAEQIKQGQQLFNGRGVIVGKIGPTGFHTLTEVDPDTFELPMDGSNLALKT